MKRLVDIDDRLLGSATEILEGKTIKETVNRALDEVVKASLRKRHAERLAAMSGLELDDPEVMAAAWE